MLYNVTALQCNSHEMIENKINMKTGICESRTPGTFSMLSLEIHLVILSILYIIYERKIIMNIGNRPTQL